MSVSDERHRKIQALEKHQDRWLLAVISMAALSIALVGGGWAYGSSLLAIADYEPREGDVIFQSLPRNAVVNAIEGATESPYSHCGIVAKQNGKWVVLEALHGVEVTPVSQFLLRGRRQGFAVCRFRKEHQKHIPEILKAAREMLGRPYDSRYRMDDEKIYCSELIWKAYKKVTRSELGKPVALQTLKWGPYRPVIEALEGGPVPLNRMMITPADMARAKQLKLVYAYNIRTDPQPEK